IKTMSQLNLLEPTAIQQELAIDVAPLKRRGNPAWKARWKAGKTEAIRIPKIYVPKIMLLARALDDDEPIESLNFSLYKGVQNFSVESLQLDPQRFQYKLVHGRSGSTGSLSGVVRWDENLAGVVLVWRDPADGLVYVVNGHNRVSLARSIGVEQICVRFLECSEASEARMIGALANIAEGRGTAIDAAKLFRDFQFTREDLADRGIPLRERIASDGLALSKLESSLFRQVIDGNLAVERAVIIGDLVPDYDQQIALLQLIERQSKTRKITNEVIRELAEEINLSGFVESEQCTLFGLEQVQESLAIEKAELKAYVRQRLSREKRLFNTVANTRNSQELERGNNRIDTDTSQQIANSADTALKVFDSPKNFRGWLTDKLNDAAREIHEGKNLRQVREDLYNLVFQELPSLSR
ncbi:MAG TPA: hypothetical protein VIQ31_04425, partial [Phormidium sp.]